MSKLLAGQIESISMTNIRPRLGEVFHSVRNGKVYVLLDKGKPVAVLSPVPGEALVTIVDEAGKVSYGLSV